MKNTVRTDVTGISVISVSLQSPLTTGGISSTQNPASSGQSWLLSGEQVQDQQAGGNLQPVERLQRLMAPLKIPKSTSG